MTKNFLPIAFYLPQFHPIEENDAWWGKGFTEWTNVVMAKKLYIGHDQPKIPSDLGFYDLRIPEVQEEQSRLALEAGIEAFCYWHYWFSGKQLLEKPLQQMLQNPKVEIPFCLAWANHTWMRKRWSASESRLSKSVLIEQTYGGKEDIDAHFYAMLTAFKDKRYYKVNGRLLFMIYAPEDLPSIKDFIDRWQELASQNGLPPFFFVGRVVEGHKEPKGIDLFDRLNYECIYSIFPYSFLRRLFAWVFHIPIILPYKAILKRYPLKRLSDSRIFPCAYSNWDNTPRIGTLGTVFHNANPETFEKHLLQLAQTMQNPERILFIKSWNEWAEGNYVEPDKKYGKGWLEAIKKALEQE